VSAERLEQYRVLLRATDVRGGVSISQDGRRVHFSYWEKPLMLDGLYRGYVYSPEPLGPVDKVTDRGWIHIKKDDMVYRQISDHWYVYELIW
jgi:hypothetical protein